jgi:Flp pilus assembly protein TadG
MTTRRANGSDGGQSMVEMAVMLPVLVIALLGIVDLARVFNTYIVITNAAREGAFYASRSPLDTPQIQAAAIREAQGSGVALVAGNITVVNGPIPGAPVTVTVTYPFSAASTLISSFWGGGNLSLRARAITMRP